MKNGFQVLFVYFVFGLMVYGNSMDNKFLIDDYLFLSNPVMSQTKFIFSQWDPFRQQAMGVVDRQGNMDYYRPMAHMVLAYAYAAFKDNYWKYHLLNLFLFVTASSLVFVLVEKLSGNSGLAFLAGLFYLIHPVNGIIVNYISAGVFAFQVVFMLGCVLLLLSSLDRNRDRTLYYLSLVFCFLSLFWNESGIMLPFYISAAVWLFREDSFKQKALYLCPYFLIILSYLVFRLNFFGFDGPIFGQLAFRHMNAGEYLSALFQVLAWYTGKLFYPQGVVMQWVTPPLQGPVLLYVLGACLAPAIFLWLYVKSSGDKLSQMAIAWLLIGFAPVGVAAFRVFGSGAMIEPHWMVFSCIGFFILAARFCVYALGRMKKAGWALVLVLTLGWGSWAHAYNHVWADQKTYALYWSQQSPYENMPYHYLARAYDDEGNLKEAEKNYKMALSGTFFDCEVYNDLALISLKQGRIADAQSYDAMAFKVNPYSSQAYYNAGLVHLAQGRGEKAVQSFDQSLALNPLFVEARRTLAFVLSGRAEYDKAVKLCLENLDIIEDDPKTLSILVGIYARRQDNVNLKKYAQRYVTAETDPANLTSVGIQIAQSPDPLIQAARDCFAKALRLDPGYANAYLAQGALEVKLGRFDEALRTWQAGLRLNPFDKRFGYSITKVNTLMPKTDKP
jgi:tetratricopeptide (TPR) repeat protein